MNDALWSAHANLRLGKAGGIDLQIVGKVVELDRNPHLDFGDRTARHREPQNGGGEQGNQLKSGVVQENTLEETGLSQSRHLQLSFPGSGRRESCELVCELVCEPGDSSSIKLSSRALGRLGAVGA